MPSPEEPANLPITRPGVIRASGGAIHRKQLELVLVPQPGGVYTRVYVDNRQGFLDEAQTLMAVAMPRREVEHFVTQLSTTGRAPAAEAKATDGRYEIELELCYDEGIDSLIVREEEKASLIDPLLAQLRTFISLISDRHWEALVTTPPMPAASDTDEMVKADTVEVEVDTQVDSEVEAAEMESLAPVLPTDEQVASPNQAPSPSRHNPFRPEPEPTDPTWLDNRTSEEGESSSSWSVQTADLTDPEVSDANGDPTQWDTRSHELILHVGDDAIEVLTPVYVIGRGRVNLTIRNDSVSRLHCRIRYVEDGFVLEDLGSTHGTLLSRQHHVAKIASQTLEDGDVLFVGMVKILCELRPR